MAILIFFLYITPFVQAHEVTLQIQVLYDGESAQPARNATVYFSDGQMVSTNKKGLASRKFVFMDSTLLVQIDKIITGNVEFKIVNHRSLQYILLDESQKKVMINAYILDEDSWNQRLERVEQVVDDQYEILLSEYNSLPLSVSQMVQETVTGFKSYRPLLVSNVASTVYSDLSDTGRNAYDLVLESNTNLDKAIGLLAPTEREDMDVTEDFLLFTRLSLLSFDKKAPYYYHELISSAPALLSNLMEYKEMAIMLDASWPLRPYLERVLKYVKDPEFQASNHNDLASVYQDQGEYEMALSEALLALDYYRTLEISEPSRFSLKTTTVMFNLSNVYRKLERNGEALPLLQESLQRLAVMQDAPPELQTMEFYGSKFIANIIQEDKGLKEAYPYYDKMFSMLKASPEVSFTLPKEELFGDYMDYCEGMELMDAPDDEVSTCYEESVKLLDNAFDSERKTLGRTLVYLQLAKLLEEKGEYEKALEFYQRSLSELEQNETASTRGLRIELNNCIGGVLVEYGRDQEALEYFQQSIQLSQISGYEKDAESLRQLAESWYNIGQFYYKRGNGDSTYYAFTKAVGFLTDPHADQKNNKPFLANAYNMKGATLAELLNDKLGSEEYFRMSVELYHELMAIEPDTYIMEYASSANNLLGMQAQHVETTDKNAALALIDSVMRAFIFHPVQSAKAEEIMASMNRYMLLFSGQLTLIQNNLMEVGDLRNQRQQIIGQTGKSDIQSRIVSKLEEAYQLVDSTMKVKLGPILSQELGNFSWYAIFDHKFAQAEASARKALAIDPKQIWVNTNLAHSLILLGKVDEGKAIYDQYKDVQHTDGQLMRAVFLSDIEELEKAGITNPAWEEVKNLLK